MFTPRWLCFLQAYLAFYVIEDMRMAKSAKALVGSQTLSASILSVLCVLSLENE
jgi:hypothetical protein